MILLEKQMGTIRTTLPACPGCSQEVLAAVGAAVQKYLLLAPSFIFWDQRMAKELKPGRCSALMHHFILGLLIFGNKKFFSLQSSSPQQVQGLGAGPRGICS